MRQFKETSVVFLEGHEASRGDYFCENNIINQTKHYLFHRGGGVNNKVAFSGFEINGFSLPRQWVFRNNTVVLNVEGEGIIAPLFTLGNLPPIDEPPGPTVSTGQKLDNEFVINSLGFENLQNPDDIPSFNRTREDFVGTPLFPKVGPGGTAGARIDLDELNTDPDA